MRNRVSLEDHICTRPMNTRRLSHALLLILALLAGQLADAAHSHHDETDGGDDTCELCLQGAKLDSFQPAAALAPAILSGRGRMPVRSHQTVYQPISARHHYPRAPPRT